MQHHNLTGPARALKASLDHMWGTPDGKRQGWGALLRYMITRRESRENEIQQFLQLAGIEVFRESSSFDRSRVEPRGFKRVVRGRTDKRVCEDRALDLLTEQYADIAMIAEYASREAP